MSFTHFFESAAGTGIDSVLNHCIEKRLTNFRVAIKFPHILKCNESRLRRVFEHTGSQLIKQLIG